ncbi:hypothetical protein PoB_002160800 [Plakobranchus ocellatus]|uniref:Secreted protein n=1 Tax=Plakobranchus ocellatus TaxID=259542 RepID=A0AAV3ZJU2_9GAST|nr:hypothetical protein PoB_002160800 [Plakobranchus ocellatus]
MNVFKNARVAVSVCIVFVSEHISAIINACCLKERCTRKLECLQIMLSFVLWFYPITHCSSGSEIEVSGSSYPLSLCQPDTGKREEQACSFGRDVTGYCRRSL